MRFGTAPRRLFCFMSMTQQNKTALRAQLKQQRRALTAAEQQLKSQQIIERLLAQPEFQQAHHISCYLPLASEVQTQTIIAAVWAADKCCYLPVVTEQELLFAKFSAGDDVVTSQFGFQQPQDCSDTIAATKLDLVLVPLLGFDSACYRLGMGAGHYDRTFAFLNNTPRATQPLLFGLAFAVQEIAALPHEPWDVKLDAVITETQRVEK